MRASDPGRGELEARGREQQDRVRKPGGRAQTLLRPEGRKHDAIALHRVGAHEGKDGHGACGLRGHHAGLQGVSISAATPAVTRVRGGVWKVPRHSGDFPFPESSTDLYAALAFQIGTRLELERVVVGTTGR